jgi:hypothetical protein
VSDVDEMAQARLPALRRRRVDVKIRCRVEGVVCVCVSDPERERGEDRVVAVYEAPELALDVGEQVGERPYRDVTGYRPLVNVKGRLDLDRKRAGDLVDGMLASPRLTSGSIRTPILNELPEHRDRLALG